MRPRPGLTLGEIAALAPLWPRVQAAGLPQRMAQLDEARRQGATSVPAATFWGRELEVDPNDVPGQDLYVWGVLQPHLSRFFYAHLDSDAVFVDVGAHVGYFSALALNVLGPGGRVISFEPMEPRLSRLAANLGGDGRVIIRGQAVWSHPAELSLAGHGEAPMVFRQVQAIALDSLDLAPDASVFLRINVAGAAFQVVQGALGLIGRHRPVISVEIADLQGAALDGSPSTAELLGVISAQDYGLYDYADGWFHPHRPRSRGTHDHGSLVCIPRERDQQVRRVKRPLPEGLE